MIYFRVANIVKLIFAFAIYITYALQCYVPVDLIWTYYMKDHFSKWRNTLVIEYVLRIVCVIVCGRCSGGVLMSDVSRSRYG